MTLLMKLNVNEICNAWFLFFFCLWQPLNLMLFKHVTVPTHQIFVLISKDTPFHTAFSLPASWLAVSHTVVFLLLTVSQHRLFLLGMNFWVCWFLTFYTQQFACTQQFLLLLSPANNLRCLFFLIKKTCTLSEYNKEFNITDFWHFNRHCKKEQKSCNDNLYIDLEICLQRTHAEWNSSIIMKGKGLWKDYNVSACNLIWCSYRQSNSVIN